MTHQLFEYYLLTEEERKKGVLVRAPSIFDPSRLSHKGRNNLKEAKS